MQYPVLMDKLSEFLMVEQGGLELYRVAASRCSRPELRQRYEEFGRETAHHREVLTQLIERLGGDPNYVSPPARVAQFKAAKLLESSLAVDGLSLQEIEVNDLENVLLTETKDHADWHLLAETARQLADPKMTDRLKQAATGLMSGSAPLDLGTVRQAIQEAVDEVESDEDEHLSWAREMLTQLCLQMATEGPAPSPARWQELISGPIPPIGQVHPAPIKGDHLLPPAGEPVWQESEVARSMRAG